MVFLSLGGIAMHAINGGTRSHSWKTQVAMTHGFGMVLSLLGGFGLLARLGVMHGSLPGWVWAKLAIWLVFGALIAVLLRKPNLSKPLWVIMILLGVSAAYFANYKPF